MRKTLNKFIEQQLSSFGTLESVFETENHMGETTFSYGLSLNGISSGFNELEHIDINVCYSNHQKLTYELGKYSSPFYTNSKSNQKRLLELLIDLPLALSVNYEEITAVDWNRYSISITGAETTSIHDLMSMIKLFKQFLLQFSQERLDVLPKRLEKTRNGQ